MLQDAQHSDSEKVKQFSLLTLGEMGRRIPLGPTVIQQQISQFKEYEHVHNPAKYMSGGIIFE